ncbi:FG-GAP-like repeat-containing protein [Candidatus Magnetobacterium casense]|uniref:VCBS repeat-containing protein n=1 Tax=Candidatus Magnetobacterium casense TaxID=1455061 RepID=A0ABS6RUD0_9BACT|nr:FG-GAP-like repeat-containing protein [Candidatus Magnetobacterium casensis]MBV6340232.1 VCBS repeat-containing protein [Candidatus Magnetobacterium casensis]
MCSIDKLMVIVFLLLSLILANSQSFGQTGEKRYLKAVSIDIPYGTENGSVGAQTIGNDAKIGPESFSIDSDGSVYIADTVNGRILAFSSNGDYQYKIDIKKEITVSDLSIGKSGNIFIYDGVTRKLHQLVGSQNKRTISKNTVNVSSLLDSLNVQQSIGPLRAVGDDIYISTGDQDDIFIGKIARDRLSSPQSLNVPVSDKKGITSLNGRSYFVELIRWEKGFIDVNEGTVNRTFELPLSGIVSIEFLQEDIYGDFYIQTERIKNDSIILEVHQFSKEGKLIETLKIPGNEYFYWTVKLVSVSDRGDIYQFMPGKDKAKLNVYRKQLSTSQPSVSDEPEESILYDLVQETETNSENGLSEEVQTRWSGDTWSNMTRSEIKDLAGKMIDVKWDLTNVAISNYIKGYRYTFPLGSYIGEAYTQTNPQQSVDEFLISIDATNNGPKTPNPKETGYGADCSGLVSQSWRLPKRQTTVTFRDDVGIKNCGGEVCFYYLTSTDVCSIKTDCPPPSSILLKTGDALNAANWHIILFGRYLSSGKFESMEETRYTAQRKQWPWKDLAAAGGAYAHVAYKPMRRSRITDDNFGAGKRIKIFASGGATLRKKPCTDNVKCEAVTKVPSNSNGIIQAAPSGYQYPYDFDKFRWWYIRFDGVQEPGWMTEGYLFKPADRDFNRDGKSDILWRRTNATQPKQDMQIWFMDYPRRVEGKEDLSSTPDKRNLDSKGLEWQIAGVGDFNGNGGGDILWRKTTNGDLAIRLMELAKSKEEGTLNPNESNWQASDWQVAGIGDFDGNGKSDILLRNTSGDLKIWFIDGIKKVSSGDVKPNDSTWNGTKSNWQIAGIGDFDGDGKSDILLRNTSTGELQIWLMDKETIVRTGSPFNGNVGFVWEIKGIGDFDGDGKSDILWRNTNSDTEDENSGKVVIWLMDSTGIKVGGNDSPGKIGLDFQIAGTGDFDGDGKSDILWRNTDQGHDWVSIWLMDGIKRAKIVLLPGKSSDWNTQP